MGKTRTFRLDGDDLHPHTIDVRQLLKLLEPIARAVEERAHATGALVGKGQPFVSLVGVSDNCLSAELAVGDNLAETLTSIATAMRERDFRGQPPKAEDELKKLHQQLVKNNYTLRVYGPDEPLPEEIHLGGSATPRWATRRPPVKGTTEFVGVCYQYHALDHTARMTVEGDQSRYLTISGLPRSSNRRSEFLELLGSRVVVRGEATWDPEQDWKVLEFVMHDIEEAPYDVGAMFDALSAIDYATEPGQLPSDMVIAGRRSTRED